MFDVATVTFSLTVEDTLTRSPTYRDWEGYSGLTLGSKIFLSDTGTVTHTKPTNGYLQILGVAASDEGILFIPNSVRTKLT